MSFVFAPSYTSNLKQSQLIETPNGTALYTTDLPGVWPNAFYNSDSESSETAFLIAAADAGYNLTMATILAVGYANWFYPLFINYAGFFTADIDKGEAENYSTYSSFLAQPLFTATNSSNASFSLSILIDKRGARPDRPPSEYQPR